MLLAWAGAQPNPGRALWRPAVTGTAFGTKGIKTGQLIRVDGNTGMVTVLHGAGPGQAE